MKKFYISKKVLMLSCAMAPALLLGACQTSGSTVTTPQERASKIDNAMQRAGLNTEAKTKSLPAAERAYKRKSNDEQAAIDYAAALRRNDHVNRASIVLEPFATDKDASSAAKTEFTAIMLAKGEYKLAERYAQQAILKDENNASAYHYLGVALDAQGMYEEAERAFRKALDLWQGDPTSIMNNLALNLASQGHLDEAAEILQKARDISPNRREIERNLRIVTALQQSNGIPVPKPMKKPEN